MTANLDPDLLPETDATQLTMSQTFLEIHALNDAEVELSVSPSPRGWRARVRPGRSALTGVDGVYASRDDAEATVRAVFKMLFPAHVCGADCRRFEPRATTTRFVVG